MNFARTGCGENCRKDRKKNQIKLRDGNWQLLTFRERSTKYKLLLGISGLALPQRKLELEITSAEKVLDPLHPIDTENDLNT